MGEGKCTLRAMRVKTLEKRGKFVVKHKKIPFRSIFNQVIAQFFFPTAYGGCETLAGNGDRYHRGRRGECFLFTCFLLCDDLE